MKSLERKVSRQKEELLRIKHGLNLIGRRIVPYVCSSYDSDKFFKWEMNCCRQTAMVVHGFLTSKELYHYNITNQQIFDIINISLINARDHLRYLLF